MATQTAITKVNLRSGVPDAAPSHGLPDTFEAHFAKGHLHADELGVSFQRLAPRSASPFAHRHREQAEELYVVVGGSGTIVADGVGHPLVPWDVVKVPGMVARHFMAGPDGLELLAFGRIHPSDGELLDLDGNLLQGDA